MKLNSLSRVWLFPTLWTVAHLAPPSMEFSRQEYWNELPLPSPEHSLSTYYKGWQQIFLVFLYMKSVFTFPSVSNFHWKIILVLPPSFLSCPPFSLFLFPLSSLYSFFSLFSFYPLSLFFLCFFLMFSFSNKWASVSFINCNSNCLRQSILDKQSTTTE